MSADYGFYLISAERTGLTDEANEGRTQFLQGQLRRLGIKFYEVSGCYKGSRERSLLIPNTAYSVITLTELQAAVHRFCWVYQQEAYLYVDRQRQAYLHAADGKLLARLGRWHNVEQEAAAKLQSYTKTPDGRYWSTERQTIGDLLA